MKIDSNWFNNENNKLYIKIYTYSIFINIRLLEKLKNKIIMFFFTYYSVCTDTCKSLNSPDGDLITTEISHQLKEKKGYININIHS